MKEIPEQRRLDVGLIVRYQPEPRDDLPYTHRPYYLTAYLGGMMHVTPQDIDPAILAMMAQLRQELLKRKTTAVLWELDGIFQKIAKDGNLWPGFIDEDQQHD